MASGFGLMVGAGDGFVGVFGAAHETDQVTIDRITDRMR
jgi:hypothetical protein